MSHLSRLNMVNTSVAAVLYLAPSTLLYTTSNFFRGPWVNPTQLSPPRSTYIACKLIPDHQFDPLLTCAPSTANNVSVVSRSKCLTSVSAKRGSSRHGRLPSAKQHLFELDCQHPPQPWLERPQPSPQSFIYDIDLNLPSGSRRVFCGTDVGSAEEAITIYSLPIFTS